MPEIPVGDLADAVRQLRRASVLVVGDAMLDEYLVGDVDRISPEAPVPVLRVRDRRYALGGAANVAQNVVAIGAECRLVAAVGSDAAGRQLASMLAGIGVSERGLLGVERPTTRKTCVVARSQQLVRIDDEEWRPATIGEGKNEAYAWKFWHLDWTGAAPGEHTVVSRAIDTSGRVQPAMDDPMLAGKKTYWESNGQLPRRIRIA